MTKEQLIARANLEMDRANSLKVKVFKFNKGELHPTIAADYNRQRLTLLYKLNEIDRCARQEFHTPIPGLHNAKQAMWSLLCSIKHRMCAL